VKKIKIEQFLQIITTEQSKQSGKSWTNNKYSVNNEENHKDNDEYIERNDVKSEQLVTQLQSNNGVTLKTSEFTTYTKSSKQPQLAAKPTTNTDQKRASKSAAKKGKNIIPARRLCSCTCFNVSLAKTDSNKELGTPDNTSKNTIFKQRYNSNANNYPNLNNSNPKLNNLNNPNNPYTSKDVKEVTQSLQSLHVKIYKSLIKIYYQTFAFIHSLSRNSIMLQKTKLFGIRDHITTAELPRKFYLKAKSSKKDPNWIHEYVSTAKMAPKLDQ